jgi:hypothetical protein
VLIARLSKYFAGTVPIPSLSSDSDEHTPGELYLAMQYQTVCLLTSFYRRTSGQFVIILPQSCENQSLKSMDELRQVSAGESAMLILRMMYD